MEIDVEKVAGEIAKEDLKWADPPTIDDLVDVVESALEKHKKKFESEIQLAMATAAAGFVENMVVDVWMVDRDFKIRLTWPDFYPVEEVYGPSVAYEVVDFINCMVSDSRSDALHSLESIDRFIEKIKNAREAYVARMPMEVDGG